MHRRLNPHRSRAQRLCVTLVCTLAATLAHARPAVQTLAPGEYVSAGGWGVLTLRTEADQRLLFELETTGANGHSCSLDGEIRNGRTIVSDTPEPTACVVRFTANGSAIDVSTNEAESCRSFCGARAGFVGRYLRPLPGCDSLSRGATNAEFKRLYDKREYREAQQQASRLLDRCVATMSWTERARLLNDLAITQHHLGLNDACVRTLQPLADDAAASDEALMNRLPPADYESYQPIVQATRTNLRLCQGSKGQP
jgi:hypothetical protein